MIYPPAIFSVPPVLGGGSHPVTELWPEGNRWTCIEDFRGTRLPVLSRSFSGISLGEDIWISISGSSGNGSAWMRRQHRRCVTVHAEMVFFSLSTSECFFFNQTWGVSFELYLVPGSQTLLSWISPSHMCVTHGRGPRVKQVGVVSDEDATEDSLVCRFNSCICCNHSDIFACSFSRFRV